MITYTWQVPAGQDVPEFRPGMELEIPDEFGRPFTLLVTYWEPSRQPARPRDGWVHGDGPHGHMVVRVIVP